VRSSCYSIDVVLNRERNFVCCGLQRGSSGTVLAVLQSARATSTSTACARSALTATERAQHEGRWCSWWGGGSALWFEIL
jgi:hypothetical protein